MWRIFFLVYYKLICLVFVLAFAACTAPGEASSAAAAPAQAAEGGARNVTLVLKNLINPFCVTIKEGAEQAAKDEGINLTVLTPLQGDNNEELMQLTEQAVASGTCDVLIMLPSDSVGIIPAVRKAHEAGIPVVMLNTNIDSAEENDIW